MKRSIMIVIVYYNIDLLEYARLDFRVLLRMLERNNSKFVNN